MRARHDLVAADEAILDALGRRLGAIDDELPRLRPWRPDRVAAGQLHVVRGLMGPAAHRDRRRSGPPSPTPPARRRGALGVGAMGLAAAIAVAILAGGRLPDAGVLGGLAAGSPVAGASGAAQQPTPPPSSIPNRPISTLDPAPTPGSAGGPGVRAALERAGWRCALHVEVALEPLAAGSIDKLAVVAGDRGGFAEGAAGPTWIGADAAGAARAFKGRPLVTVAGGQWIVRPDGSSAVAILLRAEQAPSGATAWRSADVLWPVACPSPGADPKSLLAGHPSSAWPTGSVVDLEVVRGGAVPIAARRPR
jgi:hypothetical protein